jgi:hypothetical protein
MATVGQGAFGILNRGNVAYAGIRSGNTNQSAEFTALDSRRPITEAIGMGSTLGRTYVTPEGNMPIHFIVVVSNQTGLLSNRTLDIRIDSNVTFKWRLHAADNPFLAFREGDPSASDGSTVSSLSRLTLVHQSGPLATFNAKGTTIMAFLPILAPTELQGVARYHYTAPGGTTVQAVEVTPNLPQCVSGCDTANSGPWFAVGPSGAWTAQLDSKDCFSQSPRACAGAFVLIDLGSTTPVVGFAA